jgi:hypothetical protein
VTAYHPFVETAVRGGENAVTRIAFAVWATAFSFGVLFHEWQTGQPPWSIHAVAALAAFGVILRPTSVPRVVALFAILTVELAFDLPNPWNHTVIVGITGGAITIWWWITFARSRELALDVVHFFRSISPFLRTAFILAWYIAWFAKLNHGFVDTHTACAVWILDQVPFLPTPDSLHGLMVLGTLVIEFTIPTLLIFRRTRPIAIALGFGFHLVSAAGGHTAFSGLAWSFYLLFLSEGTLARVAATARSYLSPTARTRLMEAMRSPLTWVALGAVWLLALGVVQAVPEDWVPPLRRWGAALPYAVYAMVWAWLLFGHRRRFVLRAGFPGGLRIREAVFIGALLLLVVNASSPYVGLKSRYSMTMYSNLQTEPGRWNHLILPGEVRRFHWQDRLVRFVEVDDPSLAEKVEEYGDMQLVLMDARRLVSDYPDARVVYELDGVRHTASRLRDDDVLGKPLPAGLRQLAGFRPVASEDTCQH